MAKTSTQTKTTPEHDAEIVKTGVSGLDDVLGGGFTPNRLYLIHGTPGAGKTTLALQYLIEGRDQGERVFYVTLSETKDELISSAVSHGWSLDGVDIYEMAMTDADLDPENQYTMFQPSELELNVTTKAILTEFERIKPKRVVIDSLSEIRLLAQNPLRYRRQILALKQYFSGRQCTVLMLDDKTGNMEDLQLESIVHGVISLEQLAPEYGGARRRLVITKFRGVSYRNGYHDFIIEKEGLVVFPRLIAAEHRNRQDGGQLKSDIAELDKLLGGGIEFGTSMLLLGPAGSGKSSTAIQYAIAAAKRGESAAIFTFDERIHTLMERTAGLGMELEKYCKEGLITINAIDPAEIPPGEFAWRVTSAAEGKSGKAPVRVVVIDSLNGYLNAMPEERFLIAQLHELLTYLGHKGIVTFLIVAQHGLLGTTQAPVDTSYLADSVLLLRYFEMKGEIRQLLSVVKKRSGNHERTLREFKLIDGKGITLGEPLHKFSAILSGTPEYVGPKDDGDDVK